MKTILTVQKLYKNPRTGEILGFSIPFVKGLLNNTEDIIITDDKYTLPFQAKVTSRHSDGSIRFAYIRFIADLPGNKEKEFTLSVNETDICSKLPEYDYAPLNFEATSNGYHLSTENFSFEVSNYSNSIFTYVKYANSQLLSDSFTGPILTDGLNDTYDMEIDKWEVIESGKLCTILKATGTNSYGTDGCEEGRRIKFEIKLSAYAQKSYVDVSYRLINTTDSQLNIRSLNFAINTNTVNTPDYSLTDMDSNKNDSTGCGDINYDLDTSSDIIHTMGTSDLIEIENSADISKVRTVAGSSNYRTDFIIGKNGSSVCKLTTSAKLLREGNEHFSEVFYGTFFADRTDSNFGLCATIYQAQQNYPKAVKADNTGVYVMLVPDFYDTENSKDTVSMPSGTSREQKFLLHFHPSNNHIAEFEDRSLIYQLPDLPLLSPSYYRDSQCFTDVFANSQKECFECMIAARADSHSRSYGMMNFGDTIDMNYTTQGRGNGAPVWSNNEYDFPHACALIFIRNKTRRFHDYCITSARHWMDVDVCHYSADPLRQDGMIEHTAGHVFDGAIVPSHEWVEGLLDYYHFTGDDRGLETALKIGDNVLRLLDTPAYQKPGEANARETGWALRTLTALYIETNDNKWIEKSQWIVSHFNQWKEEYASFAAQYTDNTLVRTGFMISVAIGSLMRYYRVFPSQELKTLIMCAVDDVYDNCRLDNGLFYYKELPSLARNGSNTLLLEAMAVGYELTGDVKYLLAGKRTLIQIILSPSSGFGSNKKMIDGFLITSGGSTKNFAQSFYPLAVYYKCLDEAGLTDFLDIY